MLSSLCFLVVNVLLTMMLIKIIKSGNKIGLDFLLCLIFTFLGNLFIPGFNLVISLVNVGLGLKAINN